MRDELGVRKHVLNSFPGKLRRKKPINHVFTSEGSCMPRKTDDDDAVHFQMDRLVQQNGEWFYMTREGEERGPFESRKDAEGDLIFYILECHKKETYNTE